MTHEHISMALGDPPKNQVDAWYDNKEELEERLKNGLDGLREIAKARSEAGYGRGERMAEWCFLGLFWADTCGNFGLITQGAPKDGYPYWIDKVPPILSQDEMDKFSRRWSANVGEATLPPAEAICDRCGQGWTLRNVRDYYQGREEPPRHKGCQELLIIDRERKEFTEILDRSEIPYTDMVAIPNQYDHEPLFYGPWFMIETPKGRIKIGWRKRVISIDWSLTELDVTGSAVVDQEQVTHGARSVHAWGADKAVEALRKLWHGEGPHAVHHSESGSSKE